LYSIVELNEGRSNQAETSTAARGHGTMVIPVTQKFKGGGSRLEYVADQSGNN